MQNFRDYTRFWVYPQRSVGDEIKKVFGDCSHVVSSRYESETKAQRRSFKDIGGAYEGAF
jgi:hypothetical protein